MAITILEVVEAEVGPKDDYSGEDFDRAGYPMFGGCEICHASLGPWAMYPSKSGFIRCVDCIRGAGFGSVEEFREWDADGGGSE